MTTKEKLLGLFEENKGKYLSGETIAGMLSVSRTAVWKAVKSLQTEGYQIDGVRNRGYRLAEDTDILSLAGIGKYLKPICGNLRIHMTRKTGSTNEEVRIKASEGEPEGYVLIAECQTNGKGRVGRAFFSPAETGIYMSLLLRPGRYSLPQASGLTTMAAAACCEAIENVSDENAAIKWVNDIYVRGKKVSGILTEASLGLEEGCLDYAVLGIGINVYPPAKGFPPELKGTAGFVFETAAQNGKNRLAAGFLNAFMTYYQSEDPASYVESYRAKSFVLGKEIRVIQGKSERKAVALDIDKDCRLIVKYEDGTLQRLSSGEIQVKC